MRRIAIIVVAVIVVAAGGYYLGTRNSKSPQAVPSNTPTQPVQSSSGGGKPSKGVKNPFGVFLSPRLFDIDTRVQIAKQLGVRYFRGSTADVLVWDGQCSECAAVHNAGLQFVLTIRNASSEQGTSQPVTDVPAFQKTVGEILDLYKPALVAVENEEDIPRYFSGTAEQYFTELKAACEVAHEKKIKCTNGGITYTGATWLTYESYVDSGQTQAAQSFAQRGLDPSQRPKTLSPQGQPIIQQVVDHEMSLVSRYKAAGVDYMNIHWYLADAQAFQETVQHMSQLTGLTVVTNEIGQQREPDANVVTGLLGAVETLKMPIAVWFSSDIGFARALNDTNGSLRPNGDAFASFVHAHTS
jgi:hypothetical protein